MKDDWKVTFFVRGKNGVEQNISVKVSSNNEYYARENAVKKLYMQYGNLIESSSIVKVQRLTNKKLEFFNQ